MRTTTDQIALVIFIDDDPRKDLELFDCLYNLKNNGGIDYKLDGKEHKIIVIHSISQVIPPIINDNIFNFYVENDKVFYRNDNNPDELISYKDWWSNIILTSYKNYLENNKISNWNKLENYDDENPLIFWKSNGWFKF